MKRHDETSPAIERAKVAARACKPYTEWVHLLAARQREYYNALVTAGFDEEQALYLTGAEFDVSEDSINLTPGMEPNRRKE